ncbi:hypothetical protein [Caballeronia sp. RCC_10]|jgi:hypothetical protein|uniref:hypothetical protein n=1 Tax=Caballeronia sp. RCC_10 TaxID=3239227 RepID=UPI003525A5B9
MSQADHAAPANVLQRSKLRIVVSRVSVTPGMPAMAMFVLNNPCDCDFQVVSSAFEIKRTPIGARHSLPKAGWGYAVTDAVKPGTLLPAGSELWATCEADTRTTFHGAVPATAPSALAPHYYFSGRLLYRRFRGELIETSLYRRLSYPELECSIVEPSDAGLNKEGVVVFSTA